MMIVEGKGWWVVESERVDVAVSFCFSLRLGLLLADFLSRYFSVNPETLFLGKTTNQTLESPILIPCKMMIVEGKGWWWRVRGLM